MSTPLHHSASSLAGAFSPRAATAMQRGWELAQRVLNGPGPLTALVLRESFRGIVVRFHRGSRSVVLKHFRRRDGAVNSGGFGYLRALHGAEALFPGAARVLAHDDDARLLVLQDLGGCPGLEELLGDPVLAPEQRQALLRGWLRAWPRLVRRHDSPQALAFVRELRRADPAAGGPRRAGGLPSAGLLERAGVDRATRRWVLDRSESVLWWGDAHPENVVLMRPRRTFGELPADRARLGPERVVRDRQTWDQDARPDAGETAAWGWGLLDLEGSCLVPPGLLVAEVAMSLPLVPDHPSPVRSEGNLDLPGACGSWRRVLSPAEWREESDRLAAHWRVGVADRERGEEVLRGLRTQLGAS